MKCYDCATAGKTEDAVAVCRSCGRATCMAHGALQRIPQYHQSEAGIGGPIVRLPADELRWACHECRTADMTTEANEAAV